MGLEEEAAVGIAGAEDAPDEGAEGEDERVEAQRRKAVHDTGIGTHAEAHQQEQQADRRHCSRVHCVGETRTAPQGVTGGEAEEHGEQDGEHGVRVVRERG